MKNEFEKLNKIINLTSPQLILLTGNRHFIEELSGDIANNVCLKQGWEVLEVVSCKKEYLIKRMLVNEANANYKKWTLKNEYSDNELKQIGKATVKVIEVTKRLPTIIEQNLYDLKGIAKLVTAFANYYADREQVNALVVLDIVQLNTIHKEKYKRQIIKLIRRLKQISMKLRCPIIFTYKNENNNNDYLTKNDIYNINKINKYVDTFIITNSNNEKRDVFDIDIYDNKNKIGTYKLKYDFICRKFE